VSLPAAVERREHHVLLNPLAPYQSVSRGTTVVL
jgi:hypothetical protein